MAGDSNEARTTIEAKRLDEGFNDRMPVDRLKRIALTSLGNVNGDSEKAPTNNEAMSTILRWKKDLLCSIGLHSPVERRNRPRVASDHG